MANISVVLKAVGGESLYLQMNKLLEYIKITKQQLRTSEAAVLLHIAYYFKEY